MDHVTLGVIVLFLLLLLILGKGRETETSLATTLVMIRYVIGPLEDTIAAMKSNAM